MFELPQCLTINLFSCIKYFLNKSLVLTHDFFEIQLFEQQIKYKLFVFIKFILDRISIIF